jgi:hypothetical protein
MELLAVPTDSRKLVHRWYDRKRTPLVKKQILPAGSDCQNRKTKVNDIEES